MSRVEKLAGHLKPGLIKRKSIVEHFRWNSFEVKNEISLFMVSLRSNEIHNKNNLILILRNESLLELSFTPTQQVQRPFSRRNAMQILTLLTLLQPISYIAILHFSPRKRTHPRISTAKCFHNRITAY